MLCQCTAPSESQYHMRSMFRQCQQASAGMQCRLCSANTIINTQHMQRAAHTTAYNSLSWI